MAQIYYPLDRQDDVCDMVPKMYESLEAVASNFSGASFPTNNLFVGMTCYRTDLQKTYRYNGTDWLVDVPEIATSVEALAGTNDSKMMTPKKVKEVVEDNKLLLATTEEAIDGENDTKVMTPKKVKEVVEANKLLLATAQEAVLGVNETKVITPHTLSAVKQEIISASETKYEEIAEDLEGKANTTDLENKANRDLSNVDVVFGINSQIFSAAGTHNFTVPKGVKSLRVTCIGGAGGGGGGADFMYGGNGACGYYNQKVLSVISNNAYTITVGAGAGGGAGNLWNGSSYGATGGTGGISSFGNLLSASGGGGGGGGYNHYADSETGLGGVAYNGGSAIATFGGRYGLFQEYSIGGVGGYGSGYGTAGTAGAVVIEW